MSSPSAGSRRSYYELRHHMAQLLPSSRGVGGSSVKGSSELAATHETYPDSSAKTRPSTRNMSLWDCSCVQENSILRSLFPAQSKPVETLVPDVAKTDRDDDTPMESLVADERLQLKEDTQSTEVDQKDPAELRVHDYNGSFSDELEIDDKSEGADHLDTHADDKTDHSDDTIVASHETAVVDTVESTPSLRTSDEFFKEETEDYSTPTVDHEDNNLTPQRLSFTKQNSFMYEIVPIKVVLKGSPFATDTPAVSTEESEALMEEIAKDPALLVGWQIELFDKANPSQSVGIRVVNGVKRMRGQPFKHNVCSEHQALSLPSSPKGSSPTPAVRANSFRLSMIGSFDEDSDSAFEKWSSLMINSTSNKSGWPFKLLRKVEVEEK